MKRLIIFCTLAALCLPTPATPADLTVKKYNFKDEFPTAGCCYIRPQQITVMVLPGKLPGRPGLEKALVKLSGVKLADWQARPARKNGQKSWNWREDYQTSAGDKLVYTTIGESSQDAFFIVMCTGKKNLAADLSSYQAFTNSLETISSSRGKPR